MNGRVAPFNTNASGARLDPSQIWAVIIALLYFASLGGVALAISRKRDAQSAIAWSLGIFFFPGIGLLSFLLFGLERMPGRLKRKVKHYLVVRERHKKKLTKIEKALILEQRNGWNSLGLLAENSGAPPITGGNQVTLLSHGLPAFESILESIRAAKRHVHVEEYIFHNDRAGRAILDAMIERAKAGLKVRLLVDAVGSFGNWAMFKKLKTAGGEAAVFMPLLPLSKFLSSNLRNHRKIIVVDGETAFLGGMNVGDEYVGLRFKRRHWCDAHFRVRGPSVPEIQRVFLEDWDFATGQVTESDDCFPMCPIDGESRVQIISGGPDQDQNAIKHVYFAAINVAQKNVKIATPYLVPDLAMREALKTAAMRGTDVTILTQGRPPDSWLTYWCSRYFWEELLTAGVKIYEYKKGVMHAKMLLCDDAWGSIGSANIDNRSLRLNFEIAGTFDSPKDIATFYKRFEDELKDAKQITLENFKKRPRRDRFLEEVARMAAPLL
jgi:cardiolipin synthase